MLQEKNMRFGDYIRKKRLDDPRQITLSDLSQALGISLSFLSDIEHKRRRPFEPEKIEVFAEHLKLSDEEKAWMYDLAGRESREVPSDIEDIMMYDEIGSMARFALRESKAGNATEEDWKRFIREIEERKKARQND
jgi:transcriptional regulator with XRE-family HTH domain